MLEFLNQGWVGTIVGTGGVALALILYWRSRISGIIAFQSRDVSMIGGDKAVFPAEVEVRYRGTLVPGLTSSTVWIWNAGKKTVRGVDIVAHDPLQLSFSGEVLNVKIRKVTRESVRITADAPQGAEATVRCGFEFLDPGDGGVLEVLHTGSDEAPECSGTVISLPKGPQYWGHAWGAYTLSTWKGAVRLSLLAVAIGLGIGMSVMGVLGRQVIEALPFLEGLLPTDPGWSLVPIGLFYASFPAYIFWIRRRRLPSSLVVTRPGSALTSPIMRRIRRYYGSGQGSRQ